MADVEGRLAELGIELLGPLPTGGAYSPVVVDHGVAHTSGMLGVADMQLAFPGRVGEDLTAEEGKRSARAACITVLSALHHHLGSLDRVEQLVKVNGFVSAAPGFKELPSVLDGASELLLEVFGEEAGQHARSAIGVAGLPAGGSVEVELVARVRPE